MAMVAPRIPVFCMLFAFFVAADSAGHSAPAPSADCSSLVLSMADCLSFVSAGSTTNKPEGNCCSGLKTVLKTDAECLCEGFKNSAQLGVMLNVSKAVTLPAACHVSAPSVSSCGLSIGPGAAPALSPMALSPSSVAGTPTPTVGADEAAPAPAPAGNSMTSSSSIAAPFKLLVLTVVAAVSFTSF